MTHPWLDEDLGCNDTPDFEIDDAVEQAIARCVVQMRLGDEVDVPEELAGDAAREVVK